MSNGVNPVSERARELLEALLKEAGNPFEEPHSVYGLRLDQADRRELLMGMNTLKGPRCQRFHRQLAERVIGFAAQINFAGRHTCP